MCYHPSFRKRLLVTTCHFKIVLQVLLAFRYFINFFKSPTFKGRKLTFVGEYFFEKVSHFSEIKLRKRYKQPIRQCTYIRLQICDVETNPSANCSIQWNDFYANFSPVFFSPSFTFIPPINLHYFPLSEYSVHSKTSLSFYLSLYLSLLSYK